MTKIGIITDSSACLPADVSGGSGVAIIPIAVHLPSEIVLDGDPGAAERVYSAIEAGEALKSEAPSAADYLEAIETTEGDAALVITPAVEFTVMHRNALMAADMSDRPVSVLDCRTAAAAHGLVVMEALKAAGAGEGLEAVRVAAEAAASRAELCAKIDTLESLERGGRVPSDTIERARRMDIRPVFRLDQGTVEPLGVQQSNEAALRSIGREFNARGGSDCQSAAVFHALRSEDAAELAASLGAGYKTLRISPSMATHTGAGVVGVAWLRRR